jgi:hypothetical protein
MKSNIEFAHGMCNSAHAYLVTTTMLHIPSRLHHPAPQPIFLLGLNGRTAQSVEASGCLGDNSRDRPVGWQRSRPLPYHRLRAASPCCTTALLEFRSSTLRFGLKVSRGPCWHLRQKRGLTLDNGVDGACLLAESTVDALCHVKIWISALSQIWIR